MPRPRKAAPKVEPVKESPKVPVEDKPVDLEPFVTERAFDDFKLHMGSQMSDVLKAIKSINIAAPQYTGSDVKSIMQDTISQGKPIEIGEGRSHTGIERVTENDFYPKEAMALDAFMEEKIRIRISETMHDYECEIFSVSVNGTHQPMVSGCDQIVRRKYVEVLARSVAEDASQKRSSEPIVNVETLKQMTRKIRPVHDFMVVDDPNPLGVPWLQALKDEAR